MKKSTLTLLILLFSLVIGFVGFVNPVNALVEEGVTTNPVPPGYGFIDFEEGTDKEVVASTVPGVSFTTTMGLDWLYADIRTGDYNGRSLTDPSVNFGPYVVNGYFCAWLGVSGDQGRIDFTMGTASYFSCLVSTYSGATVDAYDSDDNLIATSGWASGNLYTYTFTRLTVEAPGIAYVIVHDTGDLWIIDDIVTDAPGVPREGLEEALQEIEDLWEYIGTLYDEGEIDEYKFYRIAGALNMTWVDIINAMYYLDTERHGFDDLKEGMDYLYLAVRELEGLVKDIQNWVKWGRMSEELAEGIVEELERIQMKLVNKAREEAESERMLAVAAVLDAEARDRSVPWLWNAISYIDQYLAGAEYWVEEGCLSKAVSYYKMAFYYSQSVVIDAWHWSWSISPEDWVDQLEENPQVRTEHTPNPAHVGDTYELKIWFRNFGATTVTVFSIDAEQYIDGVFIESIVWDPGWWQWVTSDATPCSETLIFHSYGVEVMNARIGENQYRLTFHTSEGDVTAWSDVWIVLP